MAGGKFLGFVGKVGSLIGNVVPGIGIAGKLATNAGALMKDKAAKDALKKEQAKQEEKQTKIIGGVLGGSSLGTSKLSVFLSDAWDWIKKNWYIVLPAVFAIIWLLFFQKKGRSAPRRRSSGAKYIPVRRKATARPKGSAWARKMLLARRRKANARKRK